MPYEFGQRRADNENHEAINELVICARERIKFVYEITDDTLNAGGKARPAPESQQTVDQRMLQSYM